MAVKFVNDTIGSEGLCPTLLVYGAIPRPPRKTPADSQMCRAKTIDAASDAVQKEQAKHRLAFALKHTKGTKSKEQEGVLHKQPSDTSVLVYRQKAKGWEGPFPLVTMNDRTAVIQLPSGRKIF